MDNLVIRVNRSSADAQSEPDVFGYFLERGRKWWRTRPDRAIMAKNLIVVDSNNEVVAAGRIEGIKKDIQNPDGRISIEVKEDRDSPWLGQTIDRGQSRNPVTYLRELKGL